MEGERASCYECWAVGLEKGTGSGQSNSERENAGRPGTRGWKQMVWEAIK